MFKHKEIINSSILQPSVIASAYTLGVNMGLYNHDNSGIENKS
jgi:hypothetical protein